MRCVHLQNVHLYASIYGIWCFFTFKMYTYTPVYTLFHLLWGLKYRHMRQYIRYFTSFEVQNVDLYASIHGIWGSFTFKMSTYTRVYTLFEFFCGSKCPLMQYYIRYFRFLRLQNVQLHTTIYGIWGLLRFKMSTYTPLYTVFHVFSRWKCPFTGEYIRYMR